jgi:hypothetical protein
MEPGVLLPCSEEPIAEPLSEPRHFKSHCQTDSYTGPVYYLYGYARGLPIIQLIKSRRIRWTGHVVCMETGEVHTGFWWGDLGERGHLKDLGMDGWVILKWIFKQWDGGPGLD